MSSANDYQVSGSHYRVNSGIQHWDIVLQHELDYFQAQIIKYVMRHKKKNGAEDLRKAQHFLVKYLEQYDRAPKSEHETIVKNIKETCSHEHLPEKPQHSTAIAERFSDETFSNEGYYGDLTELYRCRRCGEYFRAKGLDGAREKHGHCAGKSYLAQCNTLPL